MTVESSTPARTGPVERFHRICVRVAAALPFGLSSLVAPTFLGFCVINGATFGVDLLLLTALHGRLGVPVAVAVSLAYACAFALSYLGNRVFNIRSHAPVGPQVMVYAVVVVVNYVAFILGVSSALTALGLDYRFARLVAGLCEAVYMYSMLRWVVFARRAKD